ncbi:MAG: leucine-rich repeat protein [Candidatus Paraimprobicoccus trichonymphae]|uniref:Leucine-rich repeat protein n=1 Tax=Candidatus Paraimprobicoccus trichonymphae TaxID=3033793 RepID=A0AA48I006_9FIRM|nr:MAG: leucine-rich repeat protein [Candidatus Paraimprobicoccus trichonymphae]
MCKLLDTDRIFDILKDDKVKELNFNKEVAKKLNNLELIDLAKKKYLNKILNILGRNKVFNDKEKRPYPTEKSPLDKINKIILIIENFKLFENYEINLRKLYENLNKLKKGIGKLNVVAPKYTGNDGIFVYHKSVLEFLGSLNKSAGKEYIVLFNNIKSLLKNDNDNFFNDKGTADECFFKIREYLKSENANIKLLVPLQSLMKQLKKVTLDRADMVLNSKKSNGECPTETRNFGNIVKLTIPDSWTFIREYCFIDNEKLETLRLNSKVKKIKEGAFKGCKKLKKIVFNGKLEEIEKNAFEDAFTEKPIFIKYEGCDKIEKEGNDNFIKAAKEFESNT